jgi:hypothetical protein
MSRLILPSLLAAALAAAGCGRDVAPPPAYTVPAFVPPLSDAAVGERLVNRRGVQEWHYTVVSAGSTDVVVEVVVYQGGAPQGRPQRYSWHRNGFGLPDNAVVNRIEPGRVEVGGETWDCHVLHVSSGGAGSFFYWVTDAVGAHGILKIAKADGGAPNDANAITWVSDSLSGKEAR